jgi:uncharacterized protein (TIGR01777 family)
MRYTVTGATGPIGQALVRSLVADKHEVVVLTRRPEHARRILPGAVTVVAWSGHDSQGLASSLAGTAAVVNLAGASIGSRPWTSHRKRDILSSRVQATEALVDAIAGLPPEQRPAVLVNASGIDIYGDQPDGVWTEASPAGDTFLARVCQAWEAAATPAVTLGVRVVCVRTALVVASDALAFRLMALPIRLFVGGPVGSGSQLFTWIHVDDLVGLIRLAASDATLDGPLNAVAPEVGSEADAARTIGAVLHRPTGLRVPAALLRLVLREQADLLLHGRRAQPALALAHGFTFKFPTMRAAFADALGTRSDPPVARLDSPFDLVLVDSPDDNLPTAFGNEFLGNPDDGTEAHLVGRMERVWHRFRWLTPILWLLAQTKTLFPETGTDIPATMTVRTYRDQAGRPWQTWERTFAFGRRRRYFNARLTYDAAHGRAVEHTGPGGLLEVPWRVERKAGRLEIEALSVALRLGRLRIPLPSVCSVRVRAVETADPATPDHIHIDLSLRHPWLGPVFGYEGTFRVERRRLAR